MRDFATTHDQRAQPEATRVWRINVDYSRQLLLLCAMCTGTHGDRLFDRSPCAASATIQSSGRAMQVGMREREEGAAQRAQADLALTRRVQQQQPLWQQQQRPPQHRARKSVWGRSE